MSSSCLMASGPNECIYFGDKIKARFTDKDGIERNLVRTIDPKSSHLGVCGSDGFMTGWTWDCFTHDACQVWMKDNHHWELPGGLGPNCFDEFLVAIDDFLFSDLFWGCDGVRNQNQL